MILPACGGHHEDEIKLLPVSGTVRVGDKILPMGRVEFYPDESKGNNSKRNSTGVVSVDGSYKLTTGYEGGTKEGAPPGWYKVVVHPGTAVTEEQKGLKAETFAQEYTNPKRTRLQMGVKEGGSYDIKLTK
jgi:hypothetical protein